jgi:hypothetical protein
MEVDIVVVASKLVRITTITPSSECAFVLAIVAHVSIIVNR